MPWWGIIASNHKFIETPMNKGELVKAVSDRAGLSQKDAEQAITATTEVITELLSDGDKLVLVGFGTFEPLTKSARTGRNPKTGELIDIPAKKTVKFKPGKGLLDAVK
jgi:DNA-binding protein HU-beta